MMDEELIKICLESVDPEDEEKMKQKVNALENLTNIFDDYEESLLHDLNPDDLYIHLSNAFKIIKVNLFQILPPAQHDPSILIVGPAFSKVEDLENDSFDDDSSKFIVQKTCCLLYTLLHFQCDGLDVSCFIDDNFVVSLMESLKSEHKVERDMIATNVVTIYERFPARRLKIEMTVTIYINQIVSEPTKFYIYIENLLWIVTALLENTQGNSNNQKELEFRTKFHNKFYRMLLSLHQVPYKFYFYIPLFRSLRTLLCWKPDIIRSFLVKIAAYNFHQTPTNSRLKVNDTSSDMLFLIELEMVLEIISEFESNQALDIFKTVYPLVIDYLSQALKSLKTDLVLRSIAILVSDTFKHLFRPYWEDMTKRLLPILESPDYALVWDSSCFYQQALLVEVLSTKTPESFPNA